MPASLAMASAVDWKGSVITAAAGIPRFSKVMASSTLPDEHDPQSPMAVMTTAQRPASFSASPSVTGALAEPLDDPVEERHAVGLAVGKEPDGRAVETCLPGRPGDCRFRRRGTERRVEYSRHAGISLVTKETERPRLHEGKKAECPPASPPPTVSRMSSGPRPRWTRTPSSPARTCPASAGSGSGEG